MLKNDLNFSHKTFDVRAIFSHAAIFYFINFSDDTFHYRKN